ncbi:TPA: hypothetical protein ACQNCI_001723, partial [Streptococcus pyogenes]
IKDKIIEDFNLYQPSFIKRVKQKVNDLGFVTSKDFPELINQENWTLIRESSPNIRIWLIYDKGKTVAYVWNSQKLSDNEARKKAELQLLLM